MALIYPNFSKPLLDIILFSKKLSELVGWTGPGLVLLWYFISGFLIKLVSPPFGKLIAIEQRLEGVYRASHTDLVHHAEEIAFYKGNEWEKSRINNSFSVNK
jgi:ATP-binding cassette subfamily D (ALD) protein 3